MKKYRHGDVSFHEITETAYNNMKAGYAGENKKNLKSAQDKYTVALGEVTGHSHVMTMERPKALEIVVVEANDIMALFKLDAQGSMTHEEHHLFTMAPGFYMQKIEREFDPFTQKARQSAD